MNLRLLILLCFPFLVMGQTPQMSQKTQMDLQYIKRNIPLIQKGDAAYMDELPLIKIEGDWYVSFLGKLHAENINLNPVSGVKIGKGKGLVRSVRIRLTELDLINNLSVVQQLELAGKIKPFLDKVAFDTRIDSVHAGIDLPQSFTGRNVLIGVNDWGFDYTHPMFYDTLLENTRIEAVWDQFRNGGPNPADFSYGSEFSTPASILAIQSDTSNQMGYGTHGTHVAGIAGGSGAGTIAKGMAFESKFLFTTILVDEAAALDSWYWMAEKAAALDKRLVVNMSWGLYHFGTSDGTSLLSQAIDDYSNDGVLFVSSAGNNGSVRFHLEKTFENDSLMTRIEFYNYAYHDSLWGQSIHGWGEVGQNFELKFQIRNTSNTLLEETPFYSTANNSFDSDFFVIGVDTVWYNITFESMHPQNGKPNARLRIKCLNPNLRIDIVAKATSGTVHFWNLVELTTNGGNWGMQFLAPLIGYSQGNTEYGIGEPTAANSCISVASHGPSYLHSNGTLIIGGNRSSFSSKGPRNDGAMKPDISGPGSSILSSISSFTNDTYTMVNSTSFQGRTYDFARFSGTSMSSPVVAGICAVILEINPYLSPSQVKTIVIETAREDQHTGVIPAEGSTSWGFGKIDAMAAIRATLNFVGIEELSMDAMQWEVFPNPTNRSFSISGLNQISDVRLFDTTGKMFEFDVNQTAWSVENLASGLYTVRVVADKKVYFKKLTIQSF